MEAGNYSVTIPMQDMNKKIRVTQTVARRGESDKAEVIVKGVALRNSKNRLCRFKP